MSAIWNLVPPQQSKTVSQIYYKKLQKSLAKRFQKSYNIVTERARPFWNVKSFSSCFQGYRMSGTSSSGCSPSQLLPRHRTGGIPLRVQKGSSGFSDELFCIPGCLGGGKEAGRRRGKYDLAPFWWSICLFFCNGQFQSLARQGFVFPGEMW